jgi:hypothetical protein
MLKIFLPGLMHLNNAKHQPLPTDPKNLSHNFSNLAFVIHVDEVYLRENHVSFSMSATHTYVPLANHGLACGPNRANHGRVGHGRI